MSPSVDPANALTASESIAERYLQDGEIVILAIKPSGWFVLITSWPVLLIAGLVAVGSFLAGDMFNISGSSDALLLGCLAFGLARLLIACMQWGGRLYILTNMRVLQIRGVIKPEVHSVQLKKISDVLISASAIENFLEVGSIYFDFLDAVSPPSSWHHVNRPDEVRQTILEAISRCH